MVVLAGAGSHPFGLYVAGVDVISPGLGKGGVPLESIRITSNGSNGASTMEFVHEDPTKAFALPAGAEVTFKDFITNQTLFGGYMLSRELTPLPSQQGRGVRVQCVDYSVLLDRWCVGQEWSSGTTVTFSLILFAFLPYTGLPLALDIYIGTNIGTQKFTAMTDRAAIEQCIQAAQGVDNLVARYFVDSNKMLHLYQLGQFGYERVASIYDDNRVADYYVTAARLATAAALPAYTRTGNVLLANVNGGLPNIDSVSSAVGDRILLLNGAAGADNGVYVVDNKGSGTTKWQMTRAADLDTSAEVRTGLGVYVKAGTANRNVVWVLTTTGTITLNTTSLTFTHGGQAAENLTLDYDESGVINNVWVRGADSTTWSGTSNSASIATYGQRTAVFDQPRATTLAMSQAYGRSILLDNKDAIVRGSFTVDGTLCFVAGKHWSSEMIFSITNTALGIAGVDYRTSSVETVFTGGDGSHSHKVGFGGLQPSGYAQLVRALAGTGISIHGSATGPLPGGKIVGTIGG